MSRRNRHKQKPQERDRRAVAAELISRTGGLPPGFYLAGTEPEPKPVCTGPKTPEGKAVVHNGAHNGRQTPCALGSQNARTHGLTSKRLILPGENEEAFAELREGWFAQFPPESQAEWAMVEQLARNDWFLK